MTQERKEELSDILDEAFGGERWDNSGASLSDCYSVLEDSGRVTKEELKELDDNDELLDEIRMMPEHS